MTGNEICELDWIKESEGINNFGVTWVQYKIVKPVPKEVIMAEPMETYWTLKTQGQVQWGEWRDYNTEIVRYNWGGFRGTTESEIVYKGQIPDIEALKKLMQWLQISPIAE